jgi:lysophospholipase L1-like esterase
MDSDLIRLDYNRRVPRLPLPRLHAAAVAALLTAALPALRAQAPDPDPARFAAEIRDFASWDERNSPPDNAVLFVGSSTIRLWPTADRFPGLPVINRGFGGSQISDVNHYLDVTVLKYRPAVVVLYAGDNDIAAGKTPVRVLEDYRRFVTRVLASRADTDIIFIAVKPSASRWALWPAMREANALVRRYADTHPRLHYADIVPATLGPGGEPRADFFLQDRLHLSPAGYDAWTKVVAQAIAAVRPAAGAGR